MPVACCNPRRPPPQRRSNPARCAKTKSHPPWVALCFLAASDRIRPDKSLQKQEIEGFGEDYKALYSYNTWTIYDSYKITNKKDMKIICQALSDEHQVPSRDGQSYRTAEDMAYEWDQHNKIHMVAPEDSVTRERTKNVDLDPEDQGKTYKDLYNENLGNN